MLVYYFFIFNLKKLLTSFLMLFSITNSLFFDSLFKPSQSLKPRGVHYFIVKVLLFYTKEISLKKIAYSNQHLSSS